MKKIALGQMNIEYGNFEKNVSAAEGFIHAAVEKNADLLLLPELWSSGFDLRHREDYIQPNAELLAHLQTVVDHHNLVIGGSYILSDQERFYNTFVVLRPHQPRIAYHKKHLFQMMKEDQFFFPGLSIPPFSSFLGATALAVCFDLRFPEFFRGHRAEGAETILLSAHWPLARIQHWEILLRARAIENQAFVIAVNSTGISGRDTYGGTSLIIAPDGEVILKAPNLETGIFYAEIDPQAVSQIRAGFPISP